MDNFESPYNAIGEQDETNTNWERKETNAETETVIDDPYETIEEITSKLKPLSYGTPPPPVGSDEPSSSKFNDDDPHHKSGFPYADPSLSSTLTRDGTGAEANLNAAQLKQHADLSEKDKLDPKLQPFIMSQGKNSVQGSCGLFASPHPEQK